MQQQDPPQVDTLYQTYGKGLYRTTGEEGTDNILDIMAADQNADNSTSVETSASDVGSGVSTSITPQASGALESGKSTFDNSVPGYILGFDPSDGNAKFYIGNSTSYINWDGTTLTVVGGVNISDLNIPDTTTANSFHVDANGNAWWGANVASGYASAPASILNTGAASFSNVTITGGSLNINGGVATISATGAVLLTNVAIGGSSIQYQIQNTGILSFGDGSDGAATLDGTTNFAWAASLLLTVSLGTNPSNGNTLSIVINGTTITFQFVSSIGSTAGNVLIGGSATATVANLLALLNAPATTNSTQVALSGTNQTLIAEATYTSPTATTILMTAIVALSTLTGSTTVSAGTVTGSNSTTYTMTRDVYFTNLTINTGIILQPNGYRIFGNGTLTTVGTAIVQRNGNSGGGGAGSTTGPGQGAGTAGAAVPDGYLKGSPIAGAGGPSNQSPPSVANITNSIGVSGVSNLGSTDALVTASNVKLIANWHLATLLDIASSGSTVKFTGSNSSGGGGGGGSPTFSGGGGGASAGGIIAIYFRVIVIGASSIIQANGGNGGAGGSPGSSGWPPGNGGNGGSGGVLVLVYNSLTNNGNNTTTGLLANAGLAGPGGTGFFGSASPGLPGLAGVIYEFQISL